MSDNERQRANNGAFLNPRRFRSSFLHQGSVATLTFFSPKLGHAIESFNYPVNHLVIHPKRENVDNNYRRNNKYMSHTVHFIFVCVFFNNTFGRQTGSDTYGRSEVFLAGKLFKDLKGVLACS